MGNCSYCGQKAGFLRSKHKECVENYQQGKQEIITSIQVAIKEATNFAALEGIVSAIGEKNHVKPDEFTDLYSTGFDTAVEAFLEDGVLSTQEEDRIAKFQEHFSYGQAVWDKRGSHTRVVKAVILRHILDGEVPPSKLKIDGNLPFLLQKSESIIWIFQNVQYHEQKTRTEYHGRSQGLSIRVAKGVYYRTGSFKGYPVKTTEMQHVGNGLVALTNKHLYFASAQKSFKIPYNKMVTLDQYEDGIGVQKDGATAKPQVFQGLDGWFAYNLISNLNQI